MDAIDEASIKAAFRRLDARPSYALTCGACGHSSPVPDDPDKSVYDCDQCGARTAFGSEQPRVTVGPHTDRRFLVARFVCGRGARASDVSISLERDYAAAVALEILSVAAPAKHRAFCAMLAGARDVPGAPRESGAVADLDAPLPAPAPPRGRAERDPGPAAGECQCGAPSVRANGACAACFARAFGSP